MTALSLFELNELVRELVETNLDGTFWVTAELSEVRVSQRGHCFVELVQKQEHGDALIAKARGNIWNSVFPLLKENFETTTGQLFTAGLKVLLEVRPSFSEIYGYSLTVLDIDPTYTLGSLAQRRKEIVDRLTREGVAEMNKELSLPVPLQRIAVVSSPTAAGYEDFCKQLLTNKQALRFDIKLFPALMQGERTEPSVLAALDSIAEELDRWDVVVIIRGGGAVSDLSCFDTYDLANSVAQFPLPVFTGIGHERDVCVLDLVANRQFKTPTAVAAFIVDYESELAERLSEHERSLADAVAARLEEEHNRLDAAVRRLDVFGNTFLPTHTSLLKTLESRLYSQALRLTGNAKLRQDYLQKSLTDAVSRSIDRERHRLEIAEARVQAADPARILKLGYSVTLKDGRSVRDASALKAGDEVETVFEKGRIKSIVR